MATSHKLIRFSAFGVCRKPLSKWQLWFFNHEKLEQQRFSDALLSDSVIIVTPNLSLVDNLMLNIPDVRDISTAMC